MSSKILLLTIAGLLSVGCVRETIEEERPRRPKPLDFASFGLRSPLRSVANPHGVNVIAELGPEDIHSSQKELRETIDPRLRDQLEVDEYHATMFNEDGVEVWRAGPHEVAYEHGRFQVDGLTYTSAPYAKLFLFKERRGDFRFRFHSQEVVVRVSGRWKPSVYYSVINVTADGTPTSELRKRESARRRRERGSLQSLPVVRQAFPVERLEIGQRIIQVDSRTGRWTVDDKPHRPSADEKLILEGVRPFAAD